MVEGRRGKEAQNKPIREITYETLKRAIILGDIPAGSRLIETVYSENLHISRTPLREAFRMLELDGLVEYIARHGVIVRAFTLEDIEEIFTIRNALMMLIIPSIVQNITEPVMNKLQEILAKMDVSQEEADAGALSVFNRAFHSTIEQVSDKRRILRVIESQEEYIMRFSHIAIASVVRRSNANQEHHQMMKMLIDKDVHKFSELMRHHLQESMETCLAAVSGRKDRR